MQLKWQLCAKFGYIIDIKVGKTKILLYSWLPIKSGDLEFFFFEIWRNFAPKKKTPPLHPVEKNAGPKLFC
jgi:hypothetical protein